MVNNDNNNNENNNNNNNNNIVEALIFSSTVYVDTFKINHSLNCDDKYLNYLVNYKQGIKQYTGETTDQFCNRWNNYKGNATKFDRKKPYMLEHIYKYFGSEGHKDFLNEASVTFIDETDQKDTKKKRNILDANIENSGTLWF